MRIARVSVMVVAAALAVSLMASSALAQRGKQGGRGFGQGFGPGGGDPNSKLALLQRRDIQDELEIVDDQQSKIREINDELRSRMREVFNELRDLPEEERREAFRNMREKTQAVTKEFEKKVDEVLLPNQRERLSQISLQMRVQFTGTARALASEEVATALGITEEQKTKLTETARTVEREMEEKIEKVREEGREKILSVLTSDQKEKYKKMLGEKYTPPRRGEGDDVR